MYPGCHGQESPHSDLKIKLSQLEENNPNIKIYLHKKFSYHIKSQNKIMRFPGELVQNQCIASYNIALIL